MTLENGAEIGVLGHGKKRISLLSACILQLKKGGTYELTYTVSISPYHVLEADFFLRCNTSMLKKTIRHVRKKSGYRLTIWVQTQCDLEDNSQLMVDAFPPNCLQEKSSSISCSIFASRLL